jgi:hypothetical protein
VNADFSQSLTDFLEFEWLDDGSNEFHGLAPVDAGLRAPFVSIYANFTGMARKK